MDLLNDVHKHRQKRLAKVSVVQQPSEPLTRTELVNLTDEFEDAKRLKMFPRRSRA